MNDASTAPNRRVTLRSTGGYWILAVTAALILFFIIDAVSRGAWDFALLALPWELLAVWVVYAVLVRPCVVIEPGKLTLINVARVHEIPWARIREITARYQLVVELDDGRKLVSWGAPTTGLDRPSIMGDRSGRLGVDHQDRASGVRRPGGRGGGEPADRLIEQAHERWAGVEVDGPTTVTSRVDVPAVAVAVGLLILGVGSAVLG